MKVKVAYYGVIEKVVEVDDKFADALPAWERGDEERYDELTNELHQAVRNEVCGDLCSVYDEESGELIYEL